MTKRTVARKTPSGPFYKVMKFDDKPLYCEIKPNENKRLLISYEYRRLYFALKAYYGNPLKAKFKKIDNEYSRIQIMGHLPNREYYLLLLCSWPEQYFYNKNKFIIKNCTIPLVQEILKNLAIDVKEE